MTTIVADFNRKIIACDAKHDWSGRWWAANKLHKVPGGVLGTAGDVPDCVRIIEAVKNGDELRKKLNAHGLMMTADGLWAVDSSAGMTKIDQPFFAIGSGGDAALAVLLHGGTIYEALDIACRVDSGSAPPFYTMTLEQALEETPT